MLTLSRQTLIMVQLLTAVLSYGQQKLENEVRISKAQVPIGAQEFIDKAPFDKKVRWYKEFFIGGSSVEAKTRYNGKRYSIEFDTSGNLEDVEIHHRWEQVPKTVSEQMERYLQDEFDRYSLDKLQFQYSGASHEVLEWLHGHRATSELLLRYEVVIHTKVRGRYKRFEVLFDADGNHIKSAAFILKNTDHIEY